MLLCACVVAAALLVAAAPGSLAANANCSDSLNPFAGKNYTWPLVQVAVHQVNQSNVKLTFSGNASVINGCQFTVTNFTVLNIPAQSYWYGVSGDIDSSSAFKLVEDQVTAVNGGNMTYNLSTVAGREVNWKMVRGIKLFNEQQMLVVGYIKLNGSGLGEPGSSDSPSGSSQRLVLTSAVFFVAASALALIL